MLENEYQERVLGFWKLSYLPELNKS